MKPPPGTPRYLTWDPELPKEQTRTKPEMAVDRQLVELEDREFLERLASRLLRGDLHLRADG